MRKIVFLLLILILAFNFSACQKAIKADDIRYIEIREGSFKRNYNVDEEIDFSNVYIVIVLKDKKGSMVEKVEPSMLEGFDSSTTTGFAEKRSMRVKYMGIYTSYWDYTVSSAYDINTNARLKAQQQTSGSELKVKLLMEMDTLPQIYGVTAVVNFDFSKLAYDDTVDFLLEDWEMTKRSLKAGTFSFVYYSQIADPITEDSELLEFAFDIKETGDPNITITDIVVSDGDNDINLPDINVQ